MTRRNFIDIINNLLLSGLSDLPSVNTTTVLEELLREPAAIENIPSLIMKSRALSVLVLWPMYGKLIQCYQKKYFTFDDLNYIQHKKILNIHKLYF